MSKRINGVSARLWNGGFVASVILACVFSIGVEKDRFGWKYSSQFSSVYRFIDSAEDKASFWMVNRPGLSVQCEKLALSFIRESHDRVRNAIHETEVSSTKARSDRIGRAATDKAGQSYLAEGCPSGVLLALMSFRTKMEGNVVSQMLEYKRLASGGAK